MADLRQRAAEHANPETVTDSRPPMDPADIGRMDIEPGLRPATEVPDLADSPYTADDKAPAHVAWSRVMGEVQWIGKRDKKTGTGGTYDFRGIDRVLNAVGPAIRKHGVLVLQVGVSCEYTIITTSGGSKMNLCRATVTYAVIGPSGDQLPVPLVSVGEAFDSGDKATTKAVSVALRSLYINNLVIPTNEPKLDPENGPQYEIATPKPPTVAEYHTEITALSTSVTRLRAIRAELNANPAIGSAEVEDVDGTRISLVKLVARIGRERTQAEQA